jgi:lactate dehydrogenase-like 2-hydroxyacid dehydrogenase
VVTRPTPAPAEQLLRATGWEVRVGGGVAGADGVLAHLTDPVDDAFFTRAGPQLRVVANFAVGVDNVDLEAAARHGVVVTNTPDVLTRAVAEHALALILAAAKRVVEGDRLIRAGEWAGWSENPLETLELGGRTLGIVGLGRTGSALARMGEALGMRVISSRPLPLADVLREADVVSLHVPLRDDTRHLIGAEELRAMKGSAILVNVSRGPVVDEAALAAALCAGEIAAAALDVFEAEPRVHPELAAQPNVVMTPHIASATGETRAAMARLAAENVISVLRGDGPLTPVGTLGA